MRTVGWSLLKYSRRNKAVKCCSMEPVRKLCHTAHAAFHQLPSLWGNCSSWADEQASGEYSTVTEKLKRCDAFWVSFSYQLGAAFVLLCSLEVPFKPHTCDWHSLSAVLVNPWSGPHVAAEMVTSPLAEVQSHPRALHVPFDLVSEGHVPRSSTNVSGWFSQTFDISLSNAKETICF